MSAQLERLIRIYNRLRRGPVTIEIIAKWAKSAGIQISNRQLYRDLHQLKSLSIEEGENIVEYTDEKNRKIWKLEYKAEDEKLTEYNINSFFLLKNFAPNTILEHRKESIEKLEAIFYKSLSKSKYQKLIQAGELYLRRTNYFSQMYGAIEHQQIEDLVWALHNKRVIKIESININPANINLDENPFPIKMYPLELVFHIGRVYVAGFATDNLKMMIFAIDKHLKYSLTNETFDRKKYEKDYLQQFETFFGISAPINNKVYKIKIEFTRGFGHSWMNYFWHHSQRWEQLKNGNFMLHLNCSIGRELFGFLAYGLDKCKIHQPKILRDMFQKKMQQTLEVYIEDVQINEETANKDYLPKPDHSSAY